MNKSEVAVIILNYQSWEETLVEAKMVYELFDLDWNQIIIVDNASSNESEQLLEKKEIGDYIFIESGNNAGYAAGNNIGLRHAKKLGYKYGWILNNDIVIKDKNVLNCLLNVFDSDSTVGVVNPDIYSPTGHLYNRDAKRYTLFDFTLGLLRYKKIGRKIDDLGGYGYVYRPQGCCMIVDLEKMEAIDYMDENTFLYCEELILAEKLRKKGWKCACVTKASIIHNHSKTVKTALGMWKTISIQNRSFNYYLREYRNYGVFSRAFCTAFYSLKNMLTY